MKIRMKAKANSSAALTTVEVAPFSHSKPAAVSVHETQDLRSSLLSQVVREQPFILKLQQKLRNPFLDVYFRICSEFGEEIFFILLLPGSSWLNSVRLSTHLSILLALSIGGGNFLKNYFHLPRPGPPVWTRTRLEDHGFPSTHTMSALAFSSYLFYFLCVEAASPLVHPAIGLMIAAFWFLNISFSRLYNGFHSPVDIIGGSLIMTLLLVLFFNTRDLVDRFCTTDNVFVPMTTFSLGLLSLYLHPRPPTVNPVVGESALVIGVCFGSVCGAWLNFKNNIPSAMNMELFSYSSPYLPSFLYYSPAFSKLVIGSLTLGLVKAVGKPMFKWLNSSLIIPYKNSLLNPQKDAEKKPWSLTDTELTVILTKYFTYFTVSLATTTLLPVIFYNLHLVKQEELRMFVIEV
eukprot:TRINITY_DN3022_c0_g1_i1.p1 TRINITY_DN3022_c0_g1~~TRINITY_DN3022_c0_g1_i1.p1  ORF type:complete len:405 (-),score=46.12 TRINITY_DN3022_c0_g1_i1:198-1412(-)